MSLTDVGRAVSDLSTNTAVTLTLLENSDAWRSRAVEQLTITSARVCTSHRSLQVAPLADLIAPYAPYARTARLMLPLVELTKAPLLDFDVRVDGRPAYLAKRETIAEIEAEHIALLASYEGVDISDEAWRLIVAICAHTPAVWRTFQGQMLGRAPRRWAMQRYLAEGLHSLVPREDEVEIPKWQRHTDSQVVRVIERFPSLLTRFTWVDRPNRKPLKLPDDVYEQWRSHAESIAEMLRTALHEGHNNESSADDPLLALPLLAEQGDAESVDEVTEALAELDRVVHELADTPGKALRSKALRTLAGYGRRWQAFVWTEVPLDRPFLVTSSQELSISINRRRHVTLKPVSLADAVSNHVAVRVSDGNVELPRVEIFGLDDKHLTRTLPTGLRKTREGFALYASDAERDKRVQLRLGLRVSRGITVVGWLLQSIVWLAVLITWSRSASHKLTAADLAVLVVPTTFAASLLLTRERNSLARRLQGVGRLMTGLATLVLWGVVAFAYFRHRLVS